MNAPLDMISDQAMKLAFVADWLAHYFLSPPQEEQIVNLKSTQGQEAVCDIGDILGSPELASSFNKLLSLDTAPQVAVNMQRRHTELFEGIFNKRYLLPYASFWDETGHLFGPAVERTNQIMRELDVDIQPDCVEAADHIGVQLAVLAEAIRQGRQDKIINIFNEIRSWTGIFIKALTQRDGDGYYGHLAKFLAALILKIETTLLPKTEREPMFAIS